MISTRTTISVFAILFRLRVERKNSCQFTVDPSREQKSFLILSQTFINKSSICRKSWFAIRKKTYLTDVA